MRYLNHIFQTLNFFRLIPIHPIYGKISATIPSTYFLILVKIGQFLLKIGHVFLPYIYNATFQPRFLILPHSPLTPHSPHICQNICYHLLYTHFKFHQNRTIGLGDTYADMTCFVPISRMRWRHYRRPYDVIIYSESSLLILILSYKIWKNRGNATNFYKRILKSSSVIGEYPRIWVIIKNVNITYCW